MPRLDEQSALSWLCAHLPDLCSAADRDGWSPKLDKILQDVRNGRSAVAACQRLGYRDAGQSRTIDLPRLNSLGKLGIDRIPLIGEYRCPRSVGACNRRGETDEQGREPRCAWEGGTPMIWRANNGTIS